jgi:hypothetical protein
MKNKGAATEKISLLLLFISEKYQCKALSSIFHPGQLSVLSPGLFSDPLPEC